MPENPAPPPSTSAAPSASASASLSTPPSPSAPASASAPPPSASDATSASAPPHHPPQKHPRRGQRDWFELLASDHGLLRLWWHNLHQIDEHMWRSNQPTPARIQLAAKQGIKTIINLRGPRQDGGWRLEAEACDHYGINLIDFTARSRAAPEKQMITAARDLFTSITMPALLHCKSGADRAGLMAALYLLIHKQMPVSMAAKQLSLRYLHIKQAKTGVLDAFLRAYVPYEAEGMAFLDWVDTIYDPKSLQDKYSSRSSADWLVDMVLRRE